MATGPTTTSVLSAVIPTILSRAREAIEKPTIMSEFVTKVRLRDGDGLTYNWPKFGELLTAQDLQENVPIDNPQRIVPTSQSFTTSEVGVMVVLTDRAVRVTPEPVWAIAGRKMGNAIKRRKEIDLLRLFNGLSRDLGTPGSPFTAAYIARGVTRLRAASEATQREPVEGQIYCVMHPFHWNDVLVEGATIGSNILTSASGPQPIEGITEELTREYQIGSLYGATIAMSPLIEIDSNDDAVSAIFSKDAFLLVNTSVDMKTERDRDIFLRADAMVITSEYGTGELEDQFGIKITADATVPA
jgi:hypothetical protein